MAPTQHPDPSPTQLGQADLADALARLWAHFLPEMLERVVILESAAAAATANRLSDELRTAAHSAAHKLAGSLGTFGLDEGTLLAREAEALYCTESQPDPAVAERLALIAARLRNLVENRS
jgi:HPt (histidine-containing phosphotransfer) domain-containing protein